MPKRRKLATNDNKSEDKQNEELDDEDSYDNDDLDEDSDYEDERDGGYKYSSNEDESENDDEITRPKKANHQSITKSIVIRDHDAIIEQIEEEGSLVPESDFEDENVKRCV